ncbi:MAG: hypothetical protein KME03_04685 [Aphanocapsa lilacina HA4352-LM1]|jgi:UDP:flavonoid glycosyltransferase YjiC (YdhE family)|nr:hypothetical protein [Aphanocapsa lilacina HA4352-LM1]
MTHFGVICPAAQGHFNPMVALTAELMQRGHRCTFFQIIDWQNAVRSCGADFQPIGVQEYPAGTWSREFDLLGRTDGLKSMQLTIQMYRRGVEFVCRDVPPAAERLGIDALLVDRSVAAGTVTARALPSAIERVLGGPSFRTAAGRLQAAIAAAGGVERAADICEQVATLRRAVSAAGWTQI